MALMLPEPGDVAKCPEDSRLLGDPSIEGKMACMSISGYAACAKSNVALDAVLDAIKVRICHRGHCSCGSGSEAESPAFLNPLPSACSCGIRARLRPVTLSFLLDGLACSAGRLRRRTVAACTRLFHDWHEKCYPSVLQLLH